jgi:LEA14-like dessication related protein
MPGPIRSFVVAASLLFVTAAASACGAATSKPFVSVVGAAPTRAGGIAERRALLVVVEIHNPTSTPLRLSELDYTLARRGVATPTRGTIRLRDTVAPGHTSTVDIQVPLIAATGSSDAAAYDLSGRLRGYAGETELNWRIAAAAVPAAAVDE